MAMYGNLDAVRAGTLDGLEHNFISKRADAGFLFGDPVFVLPGNETDGFLPDSTVATQVFNGVVVHSYYSNNTLEGEFPENHMLPVCSEGEIWVKVKTADGTIIANEPAYVIDLTTDPDYKSFTDAAGATAFGPIGYFTSNTVTVDSVEYAKIMVDGLVAE